MTPHDQALEAAVVACEMQSDDAWVNRHMMPRFVSAYLAHRRATDGAVLVVVPEDIAVRGHMTAEEQLRAEGYNDALSDVRASAEDAP